MIVTVLSHLIHGCACQDDMVVFVFIRYCVTCNVMSDLLLLSDISNRWCIFKGTKYIQLFCVWRSPDITLALYHFRYTDVAMEDKLSMEFLLMSICSAFFGHQHLACIRSLAGDRQLMIGYRTHNVTHLCRFCIAQFRNRKWRVYIFLIVMYRILDHFGE